MDIPELPDKRTVLEIASAIEYVKRKRTPEQQRIHEIAEVFSDDTPKRTPLDDLRVSLENMGFTLFFGDTDNHKEIIGIDYANPSNTPIVDLKNALFLALAFNEVQWVLGDLVAQGLDYDDNFSQYLPMPTRKKQTISNYASVCKAYRHNQRWVELSFGHHECLASLTGELLPIREQLMADAYNNDWTVDDLRHQKYITLSALAKEDSDKSEAAKRVLKRLQSGRKYEEVVINCELANLTDYVRLEPSRYAEIIGRFGEGDDTEKRVRVEIKVFGV